MEVHCQGVMAFQPKTPRMDRLLAGAIAALHASSIKLLLDASRQLRRMLANEDAKGRRRKSRQLHSFLGGWNRHGGSRVSSNSGKVCRLQGLFWVCPGNGSRGRLRPITTLTPRSLARCRLPPIANTMTVRPCSKSTQSRIVCPRDMMTEMECLHVRASGSMRVRSMLPRRELACSRRRIEGAIRSVALSSRLHRAFVNWAFVNRNPAIRSCDSLPCIPGRRDRCCLPTAEAKANRSVAYR